MLPDCVLATCHVSRGRLTPPVPASARYLISVRDPVARFVSAFNWRHQERFATAPDLLDDAQDRGAVERHSVRVKRRKKHHKSPNSWNSSLEMYGCFDAADAFAIALGCVESRPFKIPST